MSDQYEKTNERFERDAAGGELAAADQGVSAEGPEVSGSSPALGASGVNSPGQDLEGSVAPASDATSEQEVELDCGAVSEGPAVSASRSVPASAAASGYAAANPRVTLIVLAAVFAVLALLCWFAPKDDYSESERRYLASFPSFTIDSVTSGRFMDQFETYAQDSFPLREPFREAQAIANVAFGRLDGNGVYLAEDPAGSGMHACALDYQLDPVSVDRALAKFQLVYEKYLAGADARVFTAVIPDKGYYLAGPSGHPSLDYAALFAQVAAGMPYAEHVDLTGLLEVGSYYRTDTHWRQEEILGVANALLEAMADDEGATGDVAAGEPTTSGPAHLSIYGGETSSQDDAAVGGGELPEAGSIGGEEGHQQLGSITVGDDFQQGDSADAGEVSQNSGDVSGDAQSSVSDDVNEAFRSTSIEFESILLAEPFYGVYCGQSALPIGFDTLAYLENDVTRAAVAYDWENGREIPLYDADFAYVGPLDAYEIFLGGPLSLVTVESPLARTDRELVVFRDSFGSSLVPLLLGEYAKVTLVDLRYIQPERLADYVDFEGADVLFLQSTLTLNLG